MIAHQVTIAAKNQPGSLARVTRILNEEKINIRATTISTFGDHGFINLIVDHPRDALKALQKSGLNAELRDVLAVLIGDKPGELDRLVQMLEKEGINVENAYGFVLESFKQAVFVVDVENITKTQELIEKHGFQTIDSAALSSIEPFHYLKY
ncbi:MAG TPA: ACT domain-containing protein [Spirochaetota bacterium]|nr:ACT domain-containing protein [Spirochaetota bacterium]